MELMIMVSPSVEWRTALCSSKHRRGHERSPFARWETLKSTAAPRHRSPLANRLRDEARVASDANWFGAYARWAGLSDGDAIDAERRNTVVARMKERLDACYAKGIRCSLRPCAGLLT